MTPRGARPSATVDVDVAVVGAGFAGLYMLYRLRGLGLRAGCGNYRRECEEIVERGYEGFVLGRER
jgi:hypothetical protein